MLKSLSYVIYASVSNTISHVTYHVDVLYSML